jgi:hypothetical protein
LSAAVGADYRLVGGVADLSHVLTAAPRGIEVVEVRIDREHRRALDLAIQALAEAS